MEQRELNVEGLEPLDPKDVEDVTAHAAKRRDRVRATQQVHVKEVTALRLGKEAEGTNKELSAHGLVVREIGKRGLAPRRAHRHETCADAVQPALLAPCHRRPQQRGGCPRVVVICLEVPPNVAVDEVRLRTLSREDLCQVVTEQLFHLRNAAGALACHGADGTDVVRVLLAVRGGRREQPAVNSSFP